MTDVRSRSLIIDGNRNASLCVSMLTKAHSLNPFCLGDGIGIRTGLRNQVLGVRVSPGAPINGPLNLKSERSNPAQSGKELGAPPVHQLGSVDERLKSAVC